MNSSYFYFQLFQKDAIYKLFSGFGGVQSIQFGCIYHCNCYIIGFKDEQVVDQLLKKGQLKIDGSTLQIKRPWTFNHDDATDDFDSLLQQVPPQDSPKNILNLLNDHCLCEIFERVNHLADIHSISNVCKRFNKIALIVFPVKIGLQWINFDDLVFNGENYRPQNLITLAQVESFLCNFGSSIQSFKFRPYYFEQVENVSNAVLKMVHKYCKNIRKLDVEIPDEPNKISSEIRPMFSKLRSLGFVPNLWRDFISTSTELVDVKIHAAVCGRYVSNPSVGDLEFLKQYPQIQTIELGGHWVCRETIQFICQNMMNLKHLKLSACNTQNPEDIVDLNRLRHATINLDGFSYTDDINEIFHLQNITEIRLHSWSSVSFERNLIAVAQNLHKLKKIKIEVEEAISIVTICQIIQNANNLLEFHETGQILIRFDENDYNQILNAVQSREKHTKFTMSLGCNLCNTYTCNLSEISKKWIILNDHPSLSVFKFYNNI